VNGDSVAGTVEVVVKVVVVVEEVVVAMLATVVGTGAAATLVDGPGDGEGDPAAAVHAETARMRLRRAAGRIGFTGER